MTCIRLLISQGYPFNYFFFTGELFFKQIPFLRTAVFLTSSADTVIEIARNFIYTVNPEAFIVRNCSMLCTTVRTLRALGRIHCEKGVGGISSTNEVPEALYVQITHSLHIIYLIKQL